MTFAEKLRAMLRIRRFSQEAVAARLDVSQNLVSRWCRGVNTPDVFQGKALAAALEVGLDFLLDEGADVALAPVESKLRGLIAEIGPEEAWRRLVGAATPGGDRVARGFDVDAAPPPWGRGTG